MSIERDDILKITEDVWSSMLGLALSPARAAPDAGAPPSSRGMTGRVTITGAWTGCVTLHSSEALARRAAAIMIGDGSTQLTQAEVMDSLGELANIVAGNIKSLLPGPTCLSTPTVETEEREATGRLLARLTLDCEGQTLWVQITEAAEERREGAANIA